MHSHVKVLAVLHIVFGVLGALAGIAAFLFFGGIAGIVGTSASGEDAAVAVPILGGLGALIMVFAMALSLPSLIAGVGLLSFRPWARMLTIVLSVFDLINFPFGTALGVYGLWVLLSAEGTALFSGFRTGPPVQQPYMK